jgi:hypothetical protein
VANPTSKSTRNQPLPPVAAAGAINRAALANRIYMAVLESTSIHEYITDVQRLLLTPGSDLCKVVALVDSILETLRNLKIRMLSVQQEADVLVKDSNG